MNKIREHPAFLFGYADAVDSEETFRSLVKWGFGECIEIGHYPYALRFNCPQCLQSLKATLEGQGGTHEARRV